jgi:hypothetical protein
MESSSPWRAASRAARSGCDHISVGLGTLLSLIAVLMLVGGALLKLSRDLRQHNLPLINRWEDLRDAITKDDELLSKQRFWLEEQQARGDLAGQEAVREAEDKVELAISQRFEAELREIERLTREIWAAENWPHHLYRRLTCQPVPYVTAPHDLAVRMVRSVRETADEAHG